MGELRISVVIPIYNGGNKVLGCLDALDKQDFGGDYEVILIDDASTDDSVSVMKRAIAGLHHKERFRVIECSENGRAGRARNLGVASARGEYILFVDQDDYPDTSLLRLLYSLSNDGQIDCVSCGVGDKGSSVYLRESLDGDTPSLEDRKRMCLQHGYVFANLLKRRMLLDNGIRFPEEVMFEDALYLVFLWGHISSYKNTDEVLYFRTIDENSQTAYLNKDKLTDRVKSTAWYWKHSVDDTTLDVLRDEVKAQAFYYIFESCVLWMLNNEELYDENLLNMCWELAHEINPSWEYLLEKESRFSTKQLLDLKAIYNDKAHFSRLAVKYRVCSRLKRSTILKPLKIARRYLRTRGSEKNA